VHISLIVIMAKLDYEVKGKVAIITGAGSGIVFGFYSNLSFNIFVLLPLFLLPSRALIVKKYMLSRRY
jgi:hypothetical protein